MNMVREKGKRNMCLIKTQNEQLQVKDYEDYFGTLLIRRKVTKKQIESALKKIFRVSEIKISGNTVEVSRGKYQFYITQKTTRSKYPWYQISEKKLKEIQEDAEYKGIICIFFDERESNGYPVYFKEWDKNDIKSKWKISESEGKKKSYRWNPEKNYKNPNCMDKTEKRVR